MKRQLHNCRDCYDFVPHAHLERLDKAPPKTKEGEFIFFPSSGDVAFASLTDMIRAIEYAEKWSDRTFLIQSKNSGSFLDFGFPKNVILGVTMESDLWKFNTPSEYTEYSQISKAPLSYYRYSGMLEVKHNRKFVTIEPILQFSEDFIKMIADIKPEFVYVGYDNHNCHLPEPSLADTKALIKQLETFTKVRLKTIRKAWWETEGES